jgi:hypothetical protein
MPKIARIQSLAKLFGDSLCVNYDRAREKVGKYLPKMASSGLIMEM